MNTHTPWPERELVTEPTCGHYCEAHARMAKQRDALLEALGDLMQELWDGDDHLYADPDICSAAMGCRRCEVEDKARAAIALVRKGDTA